MELKYEKDEKVPAIMDIDTGDTIQTKATSWDEVKNIRVLAVIGDAILTEYPLNSTWSNKVYSAQQIYQMGCIVIKNKKP